MMIPILLLIFTGGSVQAYMQESDYGSATSRLLKFLRPHCMKEYPVADSELNTVRMGNFDESNENLKKYYKCIVLNSGIFNESFEINEILLKTFVPETLKGGHGLELIKECLAQARNMPQSTPSEDKFWAMKKCVYNGDPENFIMP